MIKKALLFSILFCTFQHLHAQESTEEYKKHGVVWSGGLFKSWLKDNTVGFHKVGDMIIPIFEEQKKMGFAINSHYMYKLTKKIGFGIHLGIGLDVNSYIEAPVLLFGGSISYGKNHEFLLNFGWADGKRKKVSGELRDRLTNTVYSEIPTIHQETELNTGFYLGIGYRLF